LRYPSPAATWGALYYLATYAAANIGAFAVITIMAARGEDLDAYEGLRGLAFRRPYVAGAMALFLLSLTGIVIYLVLDLVSRLLLRHWHESAIAEEEE